MSIIDSEKCKLALAGTEASSRLQEDKHQLYKWRYLLQLKIPLPWILMGKKHHLLTFKKTLLKFRSFKPLQVWRTVPDFFGDAFTFWQWSHSMSSVMKCSCLQTACVLVACSWLCCSSPKEMKRQESVAKNPSSISRLDGKWDRLGFKCRGFWQPP